MADQLIHLSFENGLDQSQDDSMLPDGTASQLENWVPEPTGGLRCRRGWLNASTTGTPATRKTKSLGFFQIAREVLTPARVQAAQAINGGQISISTWGSATTAGHFLVLIVSWRINTDLGTITVPSGWTLAHESKTGTTGSTVGTRLYYKAGAASESGTVSVTVGGAAAVATQIAEYSGVEITSPVDRVAAAFATTGSALSTGTTATTTMNKELWIGAVADWDNEAMSSPTNAFSIVQQTTGGSPTSGMLERITTATGTASTAVSTSSSAPWAGVMVTFKARTVTSAEYLIAAHDNTTSYDLYHKNRDDVTTGSWTLIENIAVPSTSDPVAFASGLGQLLYSNTQLSTVRRWDGAAANAIADGPPGRTLMFHKNRFFSGGTDTNPTRLWYSDLGSYSTWPSTSYIDIGQDDGETILDLAVFEEGLLIAKENSLWFLSGSGPNDFTVHQLNSGGGYLGRCIGVTPYGSVIAGEHEVWLWTGGGVDPISLPIEGTYGLTGDYVSVAYISGVAYICDQGSATTYCVHMQRGAWWVEKTSDSTGGPAFVAAKAGQLFYGPKESTTRSLALYRDIPGGDRARDELLPQTFKAHTPELWPVDPGKTFTPQRLYIKFRQRGGDATDTGITITPIFDGETKDPLTLATRAEAGTYRDSIQVTSESRGIYSAKFLFEQTVPSDEASLIDLEEVLFEISHVIRRPR